MTGAPAPLVVLYVDINTEWRGGQRQLLWMGEGLRRCGGRPLFALRSGVPLAARAKESGIEVIAHRPAHCRVGAVDRAASSPRHPP